MTRRMGGNGKTAVYRDAVEDVIWIGHQPERTQAPALDFAQHFERARWCVRTVNLTVVHVERFITRGDGQYPRDCSGLVYDKQHLSCQIDLGVSVT